MPRQRLDEEALKQAQEDYEAEQEAKEFSDSVDWSDWSSDDGDDALCDMIVGRDEPCFAGLDTPITLSNGQTVGIKDVKVGDSLMGYDLKQGKTVAVVALETSCYLLQSKQIGQVGVHSSKQMPQKYFRHAPRLSHTPPSVFKKKGWAAVETRDEMGTTAHAAIWWDPASLQKSVLE